MEYITHKAAPRVAWLDNSAQLDALLDRIDPKGVFSDSGSGILSVALTLLRPHVSNTSTDGSSENVNIASADTSTIVESCNSKEVGDEKCQFETTTDNVESRGIGINSEGTHSNNDDHRRTRLEQEAQYHMLESAADKFDLTLFAASSSPELFQRFNIQVCCQNHNVYKLT